MVSEFLFHEEKSTKEENTNYINLKIEIRELLKEPVNRRIFSEILFDLQKDVSGQTLRRLQKLYVDLGLHEDAYAKLKSFKWHVVSSGILELTKMKVPESYSIIKKYINAKKSVIRKQAEIATTTLKHEGINYFLDTTTYKISEWQQLKLLDVLRNFEDFQPPKFKVWFTSTNKDVVLFALRLAKYYNQNDAKSSITELIKHKNNEIKTEAIQCIRDFNIVEAIEPLKNIFWKCTVSIKLLILGAIADLGKKEDVIFLQHVAKKDSNFTVKSKALGAINTICPESIMPTKGIDKKLTNSSWKEVMSFNEEIDKYVLIEPVENDELSEDLIANSTPISKDSKKIFNSPITDHLMEDKKPRKKTNAKEEIENEFNDAQIINPLLAHIKSLENNFEIDTTEHSENLNDIMVVFEKITPNDTNLDFDQPLEKIKEDNYASVEDAELEKDLSFLPFIIDNETEEKELEINAIEDSIKKEPSTLHFDEEEISIDFLPFVTIEEEENIDATDIEEIFNEIPIASAKEKLFTEDDFSINFIPVIEDHTDTQNNLEQAFIPKAILPEITFEEETKQLLDYIEDVGDEREVLFLNELLENDKYSIFSDRIQSILKKFTTTNDLPSSKSKIPAQIKTSKSISIPKSMKTKFLSVFEELFRNCDTETKLILMNEIVAVGDEKEILFLKKLVEDSNIRISSKAKESLEELQSKLLLQSIAPIENTKVILDNTVSNEYDTLMNDLEIKPAKPTSIFDIEFEFSEETLPEYNTTEVPVKIAKVNKVLSKYSFFNKIIGKING